MQDQRGRWLSERNHLVIVHLKNVIVNMVASVYWLPVTWRRAVLNWAGVSVGEGTMVKAHCFFGAPGPITIGRGGYISYNVDIDGTGPVAVGDDVYIAAGVSVGTCTHDIGPAQRRAGRQYPDGVTIGDGCWIGMNSTILPGVTIGPGCVIAAGAVVNRDCAANGLYGGVPAKLLDDLEQRASAAAVSSAA
jgi:maltose O-acetyltransferase